MRIALIITTYNRPEALEAVLDAYSCQIDPSFEVLIADDGSSRSTKDLIDQYKERFGFGLKHVWHEDRGFRAAAIRNRASLLTEADYLIFTDGDCIPDIHFVSSHRALAKANRFVAGNRILLSKSFTEQVLSQSLKLHLWSYRHWLHARFKGDINRLLPMLRIDGLGRLRDLHPMRWQGVKTCNLAVWRKDFLAVNGFDESYEGWGMEDSDLVIRLLRQGCRHRSARFMACLFHLWHEENDRSSLAQNQARLSKLLSEEGIKALRGLDQYL